MPQPAARRNARAACCCGTLGAIVLRVVLIAFAVVLLDVPFLKFVGGLLLLWIGVQV